MNDNQWTVKCSKKYIFLNVIELIGIIFIIFTAINFLIFCFNKPLSIFIEYCILFSVILNIILLTIKANAVFIFEGTKITTMMSFPKMTYIISDITVSDFVFKQNKTEKKANVGRIFIKSRNLYFRGITEFEKVKEYIEFNFKTPQK